MFGLESIEPEDARNTPGHEFLRRTVLDSSRAPCLLVVC